jgi:hypothetical protein
MLVNHPVQQTVQVVTAPNDPFATRDAGEALTLAACGQGLPVPPISIQSQ